MISGESVELKDLSLDLHLILIRAITVSFVLISKEGSGGQQMSPELLNKASLTKATQLIMHQVAP